MTGVIDTLERAAAGRALADVRSTSSLISLGHQEQGLCWHEAFCVLMANAHVGHDEIVMTLTLGCYQLWC